MHEVGIIQNALAMAVEEAQKQKAGRIVRMEMRIGRMSGVVSDALRFAFEVVSQGTLAEGATLEITEAPVSCRCRACQHDFEPAPDNLLCPECGASDFELRRGREIELASLDVS
ncbi:MAG: hydrogenase maturation nickel metallochaperone HypA [Verrucomicrobiae bacterium]|nr:hydrogenase maturation nickel metallochaperone HypA [Verrucomicrobiae bacterium]